MNRRTALAILVSAVTVFAPAAARASSVPRCLECGGRVDSASNTCAGCDARAIADAPPLPFPDLPYCRRNDRGEIVSTTRPEALCARLRIENARKPPDFQHALCGHCGTRMISTVRFHPPLRRVSSSSWGLNWRALDPLPEREWFPLPRCLRSTGPMTLTADGLLAGFESCAGCLHSFGITLTPAQRAALLAEEDVPL